MVQKLSEAGLWIFGSTLLFAACIKLLDPFFLPQFQASWFFAFSVIVDLALTCLLFTGPRNRTTCMISAIGFLGYAILLLTKIKFGEVSCNCFGDETPIAVPLSIDIVGFCFFIGVSYCYPINRNQLPKPTGNDSWFQSIKLSGVFLTAVLVLSLSMQTLHCQENRLSVSQTSLEFNENFEWQKLSLTVTNETAQKIRIVGIPTSCQMALASDLPIEVAANTDEEIVFLISNDKLLGRSSKFLKGELKLFIEELGLTDVRLSSTLIGWGVNY